jgi:hypothetical protein
MWKLIVCIFINIKCFASYCCSKLLQHTLNGALFVSNLSYLGPKKFSDDKGLNIKFCFVHNHLPQSFVETAFLEKEQTPWQTRTVKEPRMKAQTKSSSQCPHKEQGMTI